NPGLKLANAFGVNSCGNGNDQVQTPAPSNNLKIPRCSAGWMRPRPLNRNVVLPTTGQRSIQ
ncbi:MAG TPA: hypothetical protein VFP47_11655, partial [Pyrinomonadaceae bacterium]|nr:hypothetical protein [Pyrinomonadaceae bacterium]